MPNLDFQPSEIVDLLGQLDLERLSPRQQQLLLAIFLAAGEKVSVPIESNAEEEFTGSVDDLRDQLAKAFIPGYAPEGRSCMMIIKPHYPPPTT